MIEKQGACSHGIVSWSVCSRCEEEKAARASELAEMFAAQAPGPKLDKPNAVLACMTAGEKLREIERLIREVDEDMPAQELLTLLRTTGTLIGKVALVFEASARSGAGEN